MFYIEVIERKHLIPHENEGEGFLEVNDDIENFHLYIYKEDVNQIIKRIPVEVTLEADGTDVLIHFKTDDYIGLSIYYNSDLGDNIEAYSNVFIASENGIATLRLSVELVGRISIKCEDFKYHFDDIKVESDSGIDNEYNPTIKVNQNHITVGCSINYSRFRLLQKEIESIKQILVDSGLVGTNE